ncbi:MAG: GNAT family N-acetyltransferase [Oscillospiraceae bacterium]|nr:GNAT family N-acetyltransferase [Oscillospiraceae bacterium]
MSFSFRFAEEQDIAALKSLWKTCFGDEDEYIDLFFDERFEPEQCLAAFCDEELAGMLFLLPITAVCCDKSYDARYIYAVCTEPRFRNRSVSTKLLNAAHEYMAENGIAMSLLVPAEKSLFGYYEKRGFETEFYCREIEVKAKESGVRFAQADLGELFEERNAAFAKSQLFMRWGREALSYQQKEAKFLGGKTLRFDGGYAVCYPFGEKVWIKELGQEKPDFDIAAAIAAHFGKSEAVVRIPAGKDEKDARPFAMTRWYISERSEKEGSCPCFTLVLD